MNIFIKRFAISIFCAIMLFGRAASLTILAENSLNVNTENNNSEKNGTGSSVMFIIDAGHGGQDGGASGLNGTLEKELNLVVAWMINDILNACGYDTIMTRERDEMLGEGKSPNAKMQDLTARLDIARAHPQAIFISIHMNKFPLEYCRGMTVYYSPNNPRSEVLGQTIKQANIKYLQSDNTREMKKADSAIFILNRIENPAVLVECGFLSNESESKLLLSDEYRAKLSAVIATSLMNAPQ